MPRSPLMQVHKAIGNESGLRIDHAMGTVHRSLWLGAGLVLLLGASVVIWRLQSFAVAPSGLLQVNGRIEGDLIAVGPKAAGRRTQLLVREGDEVKPRQLLSRLDDAASDARLAQACSKVLALQAQGTAQQSGLEVLRAETGMQIAAARTSVESAQAEVRRAQAAAAQEARDLERMRRLAMQGFVGAQALKKTALALLTAREQDSTAQAALNRAQ